MNSFKFSLILCTLGRVKEVELFFESLSAQAVPPSFEVIVVDQNKDGRLEPVIKRFGSVFEIVHLLREPGLSRARNAGLEFVRGEIAAFPDDDCTYPPDTLAGIGAYFDANPECDGVSTFVCDKDGSYSCGGYMSSANQRITRGNVWRCGVSCSIFVRKKSIVSRFNESLGVGSGTKFGSGEETDFLLALIENGRRIDYRPRFVVNHPRFAGEWKSARGRSYGLGMGRVLRLHGYSTPCALYYASLQFARALQALAALRFAKAAFHFSMAVGRMAGFFAEPDRTS